MKKQYRNYEESLFEALKDREEALAYLNAALEDEDQRVFLIALKDVLIAQNVASRDTFSSVLKNFVEHSG